MKKIILIFIAISLLSCKQDEKFIGYVVCKEYTQSHMSNETGRVINYSIVVPMQHVTPPPAPHFVPEQYVFYIANKNEVQKRYVSKHLFFKIKLLTKIII